MATRIEALRARSVDLLFLADLPTHATRVRSGEPARDVAADVRYVGHGDVPPPKGAALEALEALAVAEAAAATVHGAVAALLVVEPLEDGQAAVELDQQAVPAAMRPVVDRYLAAQGTASLCGPPESTADAVARRERILQRLTAELQAQHVGFCGQGPGGGI